MSQVSFQELIPCRGKCSGIFRSSHSRREACSFSGVTEPLRGAQRRKTQFCLGKGKDLYGKDPIEEIIFALDLGKWKEFWQVAD